MVVPYLSWSFWIGNLRNGDHFRLATPREYLNWKHTASDSEKPGGTLMLVVLETTHISCIYLNVPVSKWVLINLGHLMLYTVQGCVVDAGLTLAVRERLDAIRKNDSR